MKIALIGNPNAGKTSLFNQLTGLNQRVGNFPGVTVEMKTGFCKLPSGKKVEILDLPGTYSLHPKSLDEDLVLNTLLQPQERPDALVVVADASNLKRHLLLFMEVRDLGLPTILLLNMMDIAEEAGLRFDLKHLEASLGCPIVSTNARKGEGLEQLKTLLEASVPIPTLAWEAEDLLPKALHTALQEVNALPHVYPALLVAHHFEKLRFLSEAQKNQIQTLLLKHTFSSTHAQRQETLERYQLIDQVLAEGLQKDSAQAGRWQHFSRRLDRLLLHPLAGYPIFVGVLLLMFQAIFTWAQYPMDLIDGGIAALNTFLQEQFPESALISLLTDGVLAGIGGVLVFIPQIAILFAFIAILEETGYMVRVMVMMDKVMRRFGLNGKSVVPLISGVACAIPAIMATRNIDQWKERLITILITPLMSCSARLPIYTIMIALIIPEEARWGWFNVQGLALLGLYFLGLLMALVVALVLKYVLKSKEKSFFIVEMPTYKAPRWGNVGLSVLEKVKSFVWEAGKVIVAISIVLWVMASYSPYGSMERIAEEAAQAHAHLDEEALQGKVASVQLEKSYAGVVGHFIEPAIRPLGYDWKIGIALITSFAAREVFVGTVSTIYSIGSDEVLTVKERLAQEKHPETGAPMFTLALGCSLLVFYAFAMQCMSTLAVVYKETKGWKYPLLQLGYMTTLAYVSAWAVYQLLS